MAPSVTSTIIGAAGATFESRGAPRSSQVRDLVEVTGPAERWLADTVEYARTRSPYYRRVLAGADFGRRFNLDTFAKLVPVLTRAELVGAGEELCADDVDQALCCQTTGTTGRPARVVFSQSDLSAMVVSTGVMLGAHGTFRRGDRVQVSTGSRAVLGNTVIARSAFELGAQLLATGQIDPGAALDTMIGWRATGLEIWSSYLGSLITAAEQTGYRQTDFSLRTIWVGGDLLTAGTLQRARAVFGEGVEIRESFGCTETAPISGGNCEQGHLHLNAGNGHIEFLNLDNDDSAPPGTLARLVLTPFHIRRHAMPLLRYDTGDIVEQLPNVTCSCAALPAVVMHGKSAHATTSTTGIVTSRQLLEPLEAIPGTSLPVHVGRHVDDTGSLHLDIVGPKSLGPTAIDALRRTGLAVATVTVVDTPSALRNPINRRADLLETDQHGSPRLTNATS